MASAGGKPNANTGGDTKGRKRKFLPHGKPVRKGAYPLRPGVQGFFITCDGGREHQATREAISLLDTFYEDLVDGKVFDEKPKSIPDKPLNKKIKFEDSDSSDDEDEGHSVEEADNGNDVEKGEAKSSEQQQEVPGALEVVSKEDEEQVETADGSAPKKQRIEDPLVSEQTEPKVPTDEPTETTDDKPKESTDKPAETTDDKPKESTDKPAETTDDKPKESTDKPTETSDKPKASNDKPKEFTGKPKASNDIPIDDLIDEDLKQLGDRKKRLFASVDSGCNGCIFIQMHKRGGDPGPVEIVQNMMSSAASTRKHMSRFILRVLPAEVVCYASEEEITRAVTPLVEKYFPKESPSGHKFAVLYEARSNTGIDRMKIINAVAKSIPQPHKVDLSNPDKTVIVQIAKTICMIGVVERYKELSKFNLRQLTSPPEK
ncbi:unnamed protein product [Triticum turgidum subsp. durum]|uniref:THUMP domain-containing protein n=1 Tax=Triticum turgidum subsp. durum TaxID=4567 RepID=A0A9R1PF92_TRITD|nr:unnamed protein product [Triticum turgidum subsp. durum]